MNDTLIIALEACWELDPVLLDTKLWKEVEESDRLCYNFHSVEANVEKVSNQNRRIPCLCGVLDFGY